MEHSALIAWRSLYALKSECVNSAAIRNSTYGKRTRYLGCHDGYSFRSILLQIAQCSNSFGTLV